MSSKSPKRSRSPRPPRPSRRGEVAREREVSAGGVLVRGDEVAVLALPKGHVDPGETAIEAARREVQEETGLSGEPLYELGKSRYWYRRDGLTIGKTVTFFLFRYLDGDTADHDDEVEEVRWIPLQAAEKELSHVAEREMITLALAYLAKDR
jgi:8-oxo-dGTP pyrophosphatase MutT (NUDIX family)